IHEALAKTHDFLVGFTLWIKIRSTFSTAKRLFGQGVFENLVEPEKLHDTCGDRWVKPQSAFIWTESIVELDTITSVHLHLSIVVHPWNPECNDAVRFD